MIAQSAWADPNQAHDELNPDVTRALADRMEVLWEAARDRTPTSAVELIDLMGGNRATANFLGVNIRAPELWARGERGLGGQTRPFPDARREQLRDAVTAQFLNGDLAVDFQGYVAARGQESYGGWRHWAGTIGADDLAAFWAAMQDQDFGFAAQAFNDALMAPGNYDFPGAEIWSLDGLDIGFPT